MSTYNLDTCAMIVEFNTSVWTARKLDRKVSDEVVHDKSAAAKGAARVNKSLMAGRSELEDIFFTALLDHISDRRRNATRPGAAAGFTLRNLRIRWEEIKEVAKPPNLSGHGREPAGPLGSDMLHRPEPFHDVPGPVAPHVESELPGNVLPPAS